MSNGNEESPKNIRLTADEIRSLAGYTLHVSFPSFAFENSHFIDPSMQEIRDQLTEQYGEDRVLNSFYTSEEGVLQLGIFVRYVSEA